MKNNRTTGIDGIPAEACKVLSIKNEEIGILTDLFNHIKHKKIFPSEWKTTTVCRIYKGKGCIDEPGHYRGISLRYQFWTCFQGFWLAG
jgi:hypothetical protein